MHGPSAATLLTLALLQCVGAQINLKGYCPKTPGNLNFDLYRYLGRWYEYKRVFVGYQELGRCWRGTYSLTRRGFKVDIDTVLKSVKVPLRLTTDLRTRGPYAPNKFNYVTRVAPLPFPPFSDSYEVLATDYDHWTIEYDCKNTRNGKRVYVGILTRNQFPSRKEVAGAIKFLKKHRIVPLRSLKRSPQLGCRP